jgi:hypothetical protein
VTHPRARDARHPRRWAARRPRRRGRFALVSAPPGAARGPRRRAPLGVRAAGRRSGSAAPGAALRAVSLVAMGNEGEDPGAWCALSRATCRSARVFRNTLRGEGANWVRLASVSAANRTQFANCPGSASLSGAKPGQFGKTRPRGGADLLASLPHCQNATSNAARRPRARWRGHPRQTNSAIPVLRADARNRVPSGHHAAHRAAAGPGGDAGGRGHGRVPRVGAGGW